MYYNISTYFQILIFSVLEYAGPTASYAGEKIYSLNQKLSAKGVPRHLKAALNIESVNVNTQIVYNSFKISPTFGIVCDQVTKRLKSSVIPQKRFFIDPTYSKAFD